MFVYLLEMKYVLVILRSSRLIMDFSAIVYLVVTWSYWCQLANLNGQLLLPGTYIAGY
jgi:hypothetical protein